MHSGRRDDARSANPEEAMNQERHPDSPTAQPRQEQAIEAIVKRAAKDRAFRDRLLADPRAAIEAAYGVRIPPTFRVQFIEKGPDLDALVVLPEFQADGALSDGDLEHVAGGWWQEPGLDWSQSILDA
jgi:hypothetical protein